MNAPDIPREDSGWYPDFNADVLVPVSRPRLPRAEKLRPYLDTIDSSRWYSNQGILVRNFEAMLATHCHGAEAACVANATLGLTLALMAAEAPRGSLCMMPAWTFAASAHAARLAGLEPWLVDVDAGTWQLSPERAAEYLHLAPDRVGAVMPVMAFGNPMDLSAWDAFRASTGVGVVVDAAGGFDALRAANVPAVVSLHATKIFGVGEGGFIVSNDHLLMERIRSRANFGFSGSREATAPALNAKLSEYAAAVGLAAFDEWPETRSAFARVAGRYRDVLSRQTAVVLQPGLGESWQSSTVMAAVPAGALSRVIQAFSDAHIGMRRWWGGGLHRHKAFFNCPRLALPVTDELVATVLGLPCWLDLPDEVIDQVCELIVERSSPNAASTTASQNPN